MASYEHHDDWSECPEQPDFHHILVQKALKARAMTRSDAQYQPRDIISSEISVSKKIVKSKHEMSRKERRKIENQEFRERVGEKVLASYCDQWMSELFDGLDEGEPMTDHQVEPEEEEEVRHEIFTYGDSSLYNEIPPHPATILDFDEQPIEDVMSQKDQIDITSIESQMTINTSDILLPPEDVDSIFHTGTSQYDVVFYVPPESGQQDNIVSTVEEAVTVRIPDTTHMSAWTYKPSAIITDMPHLLEKARFGISLLPREKQWIARTKATDKKKAKTAYHNLCYYAVRHSDVVLRTNATLFEALINWKRKRKSLQGVEADD